MPATDIAPATKWIDDFALWGEAERLQLVRSTYVGGAPRLNAFCLDGEPYGTLSFYSEGLSDLLPPNQCCIKDWSESEGLAAELVRGGAVKIVGEGRTGPYYSHYYIVELLF